MSDDLRRMSDESIPYHHTQLVFRKVEVAGALTAPTGIAPGAALAYP